MASASRRPPRSSRSYARRDDATAEIDADQAAATRELFADDFDVSVLTGDWREMLPREAPFDFLFLDAAKQRPDLDGAPVLGLLTPGATVVLDDLTPGRTEPDPVARLLAEPLEPRFDRVADEPGASGNRCRQCQGLKPSRGTS